MDRTCSNCQFGKRYLCIGTICNHPEHNNVPIPNFASCKDFKPKINKSNTVDWSWIFPPDHSA